jgi:malate dehydrogenase (oxaloacetate-decarboxylating)
VRARGIDEAMKLAAARAIAAVIPESDLGPEYIVPSVFNRHVASAVADAVSAAAIESGIARRDRASRQAEIPGVV